VKPTLFLQSEYRLGQQRHFATEKSSKPFRRSDHCDLRQNRLICAGVAAGDKE